MVVRRLRWKNRVQTIVVLVVLLVAVIALVRLPARQAGAHAQVEYLTLTVRPGDSIWTLSTPYKPAGEDIRRFVDSIISINGLDGGLIRPGQQIKVPVHVSSGP